MMLWLVAVPANAAEILDSFTEPYQSSQVAGPHGVVRKIHVRVGQRVAAGEVLGQLDTRSLQAELRVAKLRAASGVRQDMAAAKLEQATLKLRNLEAISRKGHATRLELQTAQAEAQLAAAEKTLADETRQLLVASAERLEAELSQRRICSPFAGHVTHLHRRVGEQISASHPELATVVQLDRLRVKFYVTASHLQTLRDGATVSLRMNGQNIAGTIESISPTIDAESGTARVDVIVPNESGKQRSGVPCRLMLPPLVDSDHAIAKTGDNQ